MPYIDRSPLEYPTNTTRPLDVRRETRAPINDQDGLKTRLLTLWHDTFNENVYILVVSTTTQSVWKLVASASSLYQIAVDAFTGPGTNPVLPTGAGLVTFTGAQVVSGTVGANVIRTDSLAASSVTFEIQQSGAAAAQDTTLNGVAHFDSAHFTVTNGFVQLAGGGAAIDQIAVDANTPPGTNPVVPDGTGQVTITGAQVATGTIGANVIRTDSLAANTFTIEIQRTTTAAATDSTLNGVSHFDSADFTVDANGFVEFATQPVEQFTVDANTAPGTNPVVPTAAGDVTITGGQIATGTIGANVIRTVSLAANAYTIQIQQTTTAAAQDTTLNGVAHFNSTHFTVTNGFVELLGGGQAIDSIGVDANTAPGTNPVLPDATGLVTITGGQVATGTIGANVIRTNSTAANNLAIEIQRTTTAAATDSTLNGVCHFDSGAFSVDANGFVTLPGGGSPIEEFLVSSGTSPVVPNATGQITLTDGNGVGMTGGLNAITFNMVSPFTGDFTFTDSTAGNTELLTVSNTDNTAANASSAALALSVAGTTQIGDPYVQYSVGSTIAYSTGVDTSSTNQLFRLTYTAAATVTPSSGTNLITAGNNGVKDYVAFFTDIGGPPAITNTDITISKSVAGGVVGLGMSNTDNTNAASHCGLVTQVGGTSGGDPFLVWSIPSGTPANFCMGRDNSDSDVLKITNSDRPSLGTQFWRMTSVGEFTMPTQPAFLATQTLAQNNLPINTTTTLTINNEIYDQNGDYDNTTYTFTAPVTGRYGLRFNVRLNDIDTANSFYIFRITTSNRNYSWTIPVATYFTADAACSFSFATEADMDATDTALCSIAIANAGASQADVQVVSGSDTWTSFSGALIC